MNLEIYLTDKKIDTAEFSKHEPKLWAEWAALFEQMSPASFTAQKLYLINPIRRKYPLRLSDNGTKRPTATPAKPAFKPKMQ